MTDNSGNNNKHIEGETLRQRWEKLDGSRKGFLHDKCEKYAEWTLPYLYPMKGQSKEEELESDDNSIGARSVNYLSNRLANTLFPATRPFMRLELNDDVRQTFLEANVPMEEVDQTLGKAERQANKDLDSIAHRTAVVHACKLLLVTGNALMYYSDDKAQVYSTRDYCVVRDISGTVIEYLTRDSKAFETFSEDVQAKLRANNKGDKYETTTNVNLYTQIKLEGDKFVVKQSADDVGLDTNENQYARKDLPWIALSWNLVRGEDYGRGMVEDYRGSFNTVAVLETALTEGVVIAATTKFFVDPASTVDVEAVNESPNGSYHSGDPDSIKAMTSDKHLDLAQTREVLNQKERDIAQAFLLPSGTTRDAERVTAEEIRRDTQEIELAYGGVYSRFTEEWQEPVARLMLNKQNLVINNETIFPVIVAGLETLSRLGDLETFRLFLEDISFFNAIPEQFQGEFNNQRVMNFLAVNRGVDLTKLVKTEEEKIAEQQALQEQQERMMNAEAAAGAVAQAGADAMTEGS